MFLTGATLTAEQYYRMEDGDRVAFDTCLVSEGLHRSLILEATFGEGVLDAVCCAKDAQGRPYPDPNEPKIAQCYRTTFPLSTPPPSSVLPYLGSAQTTPPPDFVPQESKPESPNAKNRAGVIPHD